ncbi:hypothetical protein [Photorhabdus bodei]|uniref:Uncharacterized protein n=1 Tax=Photorhabdus bodei TaxID=2029681 RepID=A0ABX0AQG0_9GAMM|nr:hypothetical protein [Photorhabdus bodei]NDK98738.1 hypothetical protein [Photorhabdus bodei]NDL03666.1 hypothetical protein [Photorhabdus bodei]NDL07196.1 hypothetical protein [Photorhabdus bodei]
MMNITVTELEDSLVKFISPLGNGAAVWVGDKPHIGYSYNAELDIDDYFEWGVDIVATSDKKSSISVDDNHLKLVAKLISYENDGVLTISLGGSIIFLEATRIPDMESDYVLFFTSQDKISLYPIEL